MKRTHSRHLDGLGAGVGILGFFGASVKKSNGELSISPITESSSIGTCTSGLDGAGGVATTQDVLKPAKTGRQAS